MDTFILEDYILQSIILLVFFVFLSPFAILELVQKNKKIDLSSIFIVVTTAFKLWFVLSLTYLLLSHANTLSHQSTRVNHQFNINKPQHMTK